MNLEQKLEENKVSALTEPLFDFAKGKEEKADETILSFTASKEMSLTYSAQELQLLAGEPTIAMDYEQLWYGSSEDTQVAQGPEEQYWTFTTVPDTESEVLTPQEAHATFVDMQYAQITGAQSEVSLIERRKYGLFVVFDGALHKLDERLNALTMDYNVQSFM